MHSTTTLSTVVIEIGGRFVGIPSWYLTIRPCGLALLPLVGQLISTGQSVLKLCGSKWFIPLVDKCLDGRSLVNVNVSSRFI